MSTEHLEQRELQLHAFNDTVSVFALPVSLLHPVSIAARVVFSHASHISSVSSRPNSPAFGSERLTITCTASGFRSLSAETEPSTFVKYDVTLSQALQGDQGHNRGYDGHDGQKISLFHLETATVPDWLRMWQTC